jgi:uroporphyrinogen decarboxylase
MTPRERFLKIAHFQLPNAIYLSPYTQSVWYKTIKRWVAEGAPQEILTDNVARYNYFGLDRISMVRVEVNLQRMEPIGCTIPPVRPHFETRVLEEDDRYRVRINEGGITIREFKDDPEKMPMWLDYPVKNRRDWDEYKKRLDPHDPERWLVKDWDSYSERLSKRDYPLGLDVGSFFGLLREFVGAEKLLLMFYDDPQFVEDMMAHMEYFSIQIVERVLQDIQVDFAFFWEDMAWKGGSMISPQMFREYMMPHYKEVTSLLHSNGVDIIMVDSDGDINELIPLWIESGVNGMWPLEVQAGVNAVDIRKKFGKQCVLWGNIDKKALAQGKEAIKEEIDKKVPFLISQGGYFPGPDHLIPEDVSLENFHFYLEYLRSFDQS